MIAPPPPLVSSDVHYQTISRNQSRSAWVEGRGFAGTRGQAKPISGFRVRLSGEATLSHSCHYEATFIDGSNSRLCSDGEICAAVGWPPIEAIRVEIRPRNS